MGGFQLLETGPRVPRWWHELPRLLRPELVVVRLGKTDPLTRHLSYDGEPAYQTHATGRRPIVIRDIIVRAARHTDGQMIGSRHVESVLPKNTLKNAVETFCVVFKRCSAHGSLSNLFSKGC